MLSQRLVASSWLLLVLTAVLLIEGYAGPRWGVHGLALLAAFGVAIVMVARELANLTRGKATATGPMALAAAGMTGAVCMLALARLNWHGHGGVAFATASSGVMLGAMWWHTRGRRTEGAIAAGAIALLSFLYLGVMPGFLIVMRCEFSVWSMALVVLTVKVADVAAYFTGRWLGRHRLNTWLSPGKTWEGTAGGVLVAGLALPGAVVLGEAMGLSLGFESPSVASLIGAGLLVAVAGQMGDLLASLIKRDAGHKDSGRGVPGFGGVLDVVDSAMLAAPIAYWLAVLAAAES